MESYLPSLHFHLWSLKHACKQNTDIPCIVNGDKYLSRSSKGDLPWSSSDFFTGQPRFPVGGLQNTIHFFHWLYREERHFIWGTKCLFIISSAEMAKCTFRFNSTEQQINLVCEGITVKHLGRFLKKPGITTRHSSHTKQGHIFLSPAIQTRLSDQSVIFALYKHNVNDFHWEFNVSNWLCFCFATWKMGNYYFLDFIVCFELRGQKFLSTTNTCS